MYNDLYKAWKAEKASETLQDLPLDFYQRASGYLNGMGDDPTGDMRSIQGRLVAHEKEMGTRLLDELRETRLTKIVNFSRYLSPIGPDGLTEEEKGLALEFANAMDSFKERRVAKETALADQTGELSVVRFLNDVPEIVGVDLKMYGPYRREDVASLPSQNVQVLVKQGLAKQIDFRRAASS